MQASVISNQSEIIFQPTENLEKVRAPTPWRSNNFLDPVN